MPNRKYQGKEREGSEFIYVDLLPEMRRPRQFNVNILLIVLIAVALSWLVVYLPLSGRQERLDEVLEERNDLRNERDMIGGIITSYRLDADRITFMENIERVEALQNSYTQYKEDMSSALVEIDLDSEMINFRYDHANREIVFRVTMSRRIHFPNLEMEIYEHPYVENIAYPEPSSPEGSTRYTTTITVEVDPDA